jgi:maltose O-acetyltransferase
MKFLIALLRYFRKRSGSHRFETMKRTGLVVGDNFQMLFGCEIDSSHYWHITIGNDVTLAPGVHVLAHDASTYKHLGCTRIGKVTIGDGVFVGANSTILPGVVIGDNSIIGAGSVVTKDIEPNVVACGNPARTICTLDEFVEKHRQGMEEYPVFSDEYTLGKNITLASRQEMNDKMSDRFGYVR